MFPKSPVPAARALGRSRWALLLVSAPLFFVACADNATLAGPNEPAQAPPVDSVPPRDSTPPRDSVPPRDSTPPRPASPYVLLFDRHESDMSPILRPRLMRTAFVVGDSASPASLIDSAVQPVLDLAGAYDASLAPNGRDLLMTCTTGHGTTLCAATLDSLGVAGRLRVQAGIRMDSLLADQAAISPDGQRVAFRGWMPGGPVGLFNPGDIYVMNLDGTGLVRLTNAVRGQSSYEGPTWSPQPINGTYRIAFAHEQRSADGYMVARLESMRDDGGDVQALTLDAEASDRAPAWSPDGRTVAFVRRSSSLVGDLWTVRLDANARPVTEQALMTLDPDGEQRAPAWSPDGARLAFVSAHEILGNFYNWQVYSVTADGRDLRRHTSTAHEHANPLWRQRASLP